MPGVPMQGAPRPAPQMPTGMPRTPQGYGQMSPGVHPQMLRHARQFAKSQEEAVIKEAQEKEKEEAKKIDRLQEELNKIKQESQE